MSKEKEKIVEDMALEDEPEFDVEDMSLEGPEPSKVEADLKETGKGSIRIKPGFEITKMASGEYRLNGVKPLSDLSSGDLGTIADYLKDSKNE